MLGSDRPTVIALDTGGWRTAKPEHSRNESVHRRRVMRLIGRKSGRIAIGHGRDEVRTYSRTVVFPKTPTIYAELAMIGISAQPGFGDFSHVNSGITAVTKANGEEIIFSRLRGMLRVNDATAVTFYFEAVSAVATFQYSVSRWEPNPTPVG
jgi:hypothetical protein